MIIDIGEKLKELRLSKGLIQDQVAERIGVTKSTMSAYEVGTRQPSFDTLVRLARLYHVSTDYLLGMTDTAVSFDGLTEQQTRVLRELIDLLKNK